MSASSLSSKGESHDDAKTIPSGHDDARRGVGLARRAAGSIQIGAGVERRRSGAPPAHRERRAHADQGVVRARASQTAPVARRQARGLRAQDRQQRRALGVFHRRPAARPTLHAAARRRRREKTCRPVAAEDLPVSGREERIAAGADVHLPGRARRAQTLSADAAAHPPRRAGPVVRARCADCDRRPGVLGPALAHRHYTLRPRPGGARLRGRFRPHDSGPRDAQRIGAEARRRPADRPTLWNAVPVDPGVFHARRSRLFRQRRSGRPPGHIPARRVHVPRDARYAVPLLPGISSGGELPPWPARRQCVRPRGGGVGKLRHAALRQARGVPHVRLPRIHHARGEERRVRTAGCRELAETAHGGGRHGPSRQRAFHADRLERREMGRVVRGRRAQRASHDRSDETLLATGLARAARPARQGRLGDEGAHALFHQRRPARDRRRGHAPHQRFRSLRQSGRLDPHRADRHGRRGLALRVPRHAPADSRRPGVRGALSGDRAPRIYPARHDAGPRDGALLPVGLPQRVSRGHRHVAAVPHERMEAASCARLRRGVQRVERPLSLISAPSMTPGIEYALGAMLFFGLGDLVYKRGAAAGTQPHHFLMVQAWVFAPSVALYAIWKGSLHFVAGSLWGALAGLFMLVGFYNFAHSLRTGSISINAPIFRLSFVLTAALAVVLLGEPLTRHKVAGIALALAAVWLLLGAPASGDAAGRRESRSSLARVLIATATVGIGNFIYKLGLQAGADPASMITAQGVVVITLATAFAGAVDARVRPSRAALRYAPMAAVVLAFAFAFMVEGMKRAQASVVVPIAQMGFVVTALLGFLFLREPFTARKGVGLAAALAALASLAYS